MLHSRVGDAPYSYAAREGTVQSAATVQVAVGSPVSMRSNRSICRIRFLLLQRIRLIAAECECECECDCECVLYPTLPLNGLLFECGRGGVGVDVKWIRPF